MFKATFQVCVSLFIFLAKIKIIFFLIKMLEVDPRWWQNRWKLH